MSKLIGELLVDAKALTREQLEETLRLTREPGKKIGHVLVERGLVTEAQLTQSLSLQLSVPWVSLYHIDFSRQLLTRIPREVAEHFCMVPIYVRSVKGSGETLYVATEDPTNQEALVAASKAAGLPVRPMIASPSDIRSAIRVYYGGSASGEEPSKEPLVTAQSSLPPGPPPPSSVNAEPRPQAPTSPEIRPPAIGASSAQPNVAGAAVPGAPGAPAVAPNAIPNAPPSAPYGPADARGAPPPLPPKRPGRPPPPSANDTGAHALAAATGPLAPMAPPPPSRPPPPPRASGRRSDAPPAAAPHAGPDSPDAAPEIEAREISVKRGPRMVALTLLDGTSLTLPARPRRRSEAPPAGISEQLTSRDLIAALRALSHGADVTEILGDNVHWEAMFAALLSILLKKGIIADWEFVEELRKI